MTKFIYMLLDGPRPAQLGIHAPGPLAPQCRL